MTSLIHVIYASAAARPFTDAELAELLSRARAKNASLDVTGMLLYSEGSFLQVLEGEEPTIRALYRTIAADDRHGRMIKLIEEPISARAFADWSMSFTAMSVEELRDLPGLSDVLEGGEDLLRLGPGRARDLIRAFIDGRWRSRLAA